MTWPNEYRTIVVCIDSYDLGVPVGRLYHPSHQGVWFESLSRMLSRMEDAMNAIRFPQSFTAKRSFSEEAAPQIQADSGGKVQTGMLATFLVKILFRQNASWQGSVRWLEGDREESFRSALELIFLMDSAMIDERAKRLKEESV